MSWLPPTPAHARPERPWLPPDLELSPEELTAFSYIVVEEIVGPRVTLIVSRWPGVDGKGRLDFEGRSRLATVALRDLERRLSQEREMPAPERLEQGEREALRRRAVAVGDVFAGRVKDGRLGSDLDRWLAPPLIDISRQAREAAQASFLAAVTPTLDPERARRILEFPDDERSRDR